MVILKVIYMEENLDMFVGRLIGLDSRAVELKKQSDAELAEMEEQVKKELRSYEASLEEAIVAAKQKHDEIIETARQQAKAEDEAIKAKIDKLQAYFESIKESTAKDIWGQLLNDER